MPLRISAAQVVPEVTVALRGDLDAAGGYDVVRRIAHARADGCSDLVLDLTGVDDVDLAGLSRLLWAVRRAHPHGRVRVLARRSEVRQLLSSTEYAHLLVAPGSHQPVPRPRAGSRSRTRA